MNQSAIRMLKNINEKQNVTTLLGENGIVWATPTYLRDYYWEFSLKTISQKSSKKFQNFKKEFISLCQSLCKNFQNICKFQKFWNLFIIFLVLRNTCYNV
jgi:exosome complex RNA-binding protein Rrp4